MSYQDGRGRGADRSSYGYDGPSTARQPSSPGKRTLTAQLASRPGTLVSHVRQLALAPTGARAPGGEPATDWSLVACRPDVYWTSEMSSAPAQRKASDASVTPDAEASRTGGGAAMPAEVRAKMESAFGADFSAVRIHAGPHAEALGALAYTQGSDIHFAPGQYDPHSQQGQALLGHELTHVVQQAEGRVQATTQAKGVAINDDAALERQADEMGARAAQGQPVAPSSTSAGGGSAQRAAGSHLPLQAKTADGGPQATALIVDDAAEPSSGQVKKTELLARLHQAIHAVGMEEYRGTELTVEGCPYIAYWFERYREKDGSSLERALRTYASASAAASVAELVAAVCDRARKGFQNQARTGEVSELPEDVPAEIGQGVVPEHPKPAQRKLLASAGSAAVAQRGCLQGGGGGGGGAPAPVTRQVAMGDFVTVNDGHTTLSTSGFAGCIGIICIAPGNTRTLAHIYSGHITSAQNWTRLAAFRNAAAAATTTHIYHALTTWHQGDGGGGDQFIQDYGLVGTIVFHGAPLVVSVDPALTVTP